MKSTTSPVLFSLLALLSPTVSGYACSASNAVTPASLTSSGGGGSDGLNQVIQSGGCSFLAASGAGTCTTTSPYKRSTAEDDVATVSKRAPTTLSVLPCLDRMTCLIIETGHLYCVDLANMDYIDELGGCGNLNTKQYEEGCVQNAASPSTTPTTSSSSVVSTSKAQAQSNAGAATRMDRAILVAVGLAAGVVSCF
jgi:hypothetical protein